MGNAVHDNGRWSRFVVVSSGTTCSCAAVDVSPQPPPPPRSHVLVLVVVVVVVLLLCVDFVTCTAAAADGRQQSFPETPARRPDMAELRHNIIKGLKLDKLPDMAKVEIGNDEFHCKYLEYFRRLYMDEDDYSAAAGYDNDVSAIQVQGQVKREPAAGSGADGRARNTKYVTFPVHWKVRQTEDSAIIRAVVRLYGQRTRPAGAEPMRVRTHGRLYTAAGGPAVAEPVADIEWTARGRDDGRWLDVDVTEMLRRPRDRRNGTLELSVRASDASAEFGHRTPVLHMFLNGVDPDDVANDTTAVACADGDVRKRRKRDSGGGGVKRPLQTTFPTDGGGSGRRRRTDCKPAAPPVDDKTATTSNRSNATVTEHNNNKCCREEMRVVFADIPGFDFIIEPKWFDAGLCRGRCPAKYNPATRHAFIQSLLWKQHAPSRRQQQETEQAQRYGRHRVRHHGGRRDGGSSVAAQQPPPPPKPCCAPSKLDRLQIVHIDELNPTNLKVTTWKEMAVVECACS